MIEPTRPTDNQPNPGRRGQRRRGQIKPVSDSGEVGRAWEAVGQLLVAGSDARLNKAPAPCQSVSAEAIAQTELTLQSRLRGGLYGIG